MQLLGVEFCRKISFQVSKSHVQFKDYSTISLSENVIAKG